MFSWNEDDDPKEFGIELDRWLRINSRTLLWTGAPPEELLYDLGRELVGNSDCVFLPLDDIVVISHYLILIERAWWNSKNKIYIYVLVMYIHVKRGLGQQELGANERIERITWHKHAGETLGQFGGSRDESSGALWRRNACRARHTADLWRRQLQAKQPS